MPLPAAASPRPAPPGRQALTGPLLLLATSAAVLLLLQAGRALLRQLPQADPRWSTGVLELQRRLASDPESRRDAALLLHGRAEGQLRRRWLLLKSQGWGSSPLAAAVLKLQALDAEALGKASTAQQLWMQLQRRFPDAPANADALYVLGRGQPALRLALLQRFPAHPAALAAAAELAGTPQLQLQGTRHLARWGPRWPGAAALLQQSCSRPDRLNRADRQLLAGALAQLGDGPQAAACLGTDPAPAATELNLAQSLLRDPAGTAAGQERLLTLVQSQPTSPEAEAAVRLLSDQQGSGVGALLNRLPDRWRLSAPVQAHLAALGQTGWPAVLRRWPDDPASWDLQWTLARRALLHRDWPTARQLLQALPPQRLPMALAARQRFWLGWSQRQLGEDAAARRQWQALLTAAPGGYYGWRAAIQLGQADGQLNHPSPPPRQAGAEWTPLGSGRRLVDQLWRLGQPLEAWESWRHQRRGRPPHGADELLSEGRLRLAIGDDWTGLGQLEQASLRQGEGSCQRWLILERALHPPRFTDLFDRLSSQNGLPAGLLTGLAKQESRFSPGVQSVAGAVGLMQLMPETAAELAGRALSVEQLQQSERNASLGARYLGRLLEHWGGQVIPATASYNAGSGAVAGWLNGELQTAPELWVETIPYPETRLYVKKVLGNAWSYQQLPRWRC